MGICYGLHAAIIDIARNVAGLENANSTEVNPNTPYPVIALITEWTNEDGDLIYEGEITKYGVTPMASTAELTAAQNRLTMSVNIRYINTKNEDDNFEREFSFYFDFPGELQVYDVKDDALREIFERLTQDIFNQTLAKW